jgi:uncharacterized protein
VTAKPRIKPAELEQPAPPAAADLSAAEARTLAVRASIGDGNATNALDVLRRLGILQLDPLRRVDRAHRLTCLARMPATASAAAIDIDLWCAGPARVFETWVHAACLLPADDWPLLRLHRERTLRRTNRPSDQACAEVLAVVADHPTGATITQLEHADTRTAGWHWSEHKRAAEHLLWTGQLICSERRNNRRVYDLAERRLPAELLTADLDREEILTGVAERALGAMGIATTHDVASYYNLLPADALEALQLAGAQQVIVEGWAAPGWLLPRHISVVDELVLPRPSLIGPFDNLIFDRDRTRRVLQFNYTFEAYKPAAKRVYGHYVMAILNTTGSLVGRVDLQRECARVAVLADYAEDGVPPYVLVEVLGSALEALGQQLASVDA